MHPAPQFQWDDEPAMLAAARAMGWARIFAMTPAGPRVAHVAVVVDEARRVLRFHLAKANLIVPGLTEGRVLALFEGPHAYVSASWYAEPERHVPTWNYVAIECEGPVIELGHDAMHGLLDDSARHNESVVGGDWSITTGDETRIVGMMAAIVAYEMPIEAMRGTRKLSQDDGADRAGLAAGVDRHGGEQLAALMRAEP